MKYEIMTKQQAIAIHEVNGEPTMSSLRIAEVTGKEHRNVLRDIEKVFSNCGIGQLRFERSYLTPQNKESKHYLLPEREFNLVISGYSDKYRLQLIDELMSYRKNKPIVELTPLELMAKAYEIEAMNHKETQKQLTIQKKISDILENEINAIASTNGLLDMKTFSMLVTSRTNGVDFGRTKVYQVLRECGLVGDDTRPTQRGLNSYLEVKMVASNNGKLHPKTFIIGDKFEKLLELMIRKIKENKPLNELLSYPFGK